MKRILILTLLFIFIIPSLSEAQLKNILKRKSEEVVEEGIDEGVDSILGNKKDDKKDERAEDEEVSESEEQTTGETTAATTGTTEEKAVLKWAKYDFVPGDQIIFEDDLMFEENGEFPSRWDLVRGNAEVAEFGGDMVIMLRDGHPSIVPFFKDPQNDYLPDVFTIEFDLYYPGSGSLEVHLYDRKNQESGSPTGYTDISITHEEMEIATFKSRLPGENIKKSRWMHIAIAYTNGKLKAYMDETRLLNVPRIDFDPKGLTLYTYHANNENLYYIKNIRIAKGGVKYYDRVMEDGKIVTNGIRFDVNKSTLKPESMGIINEIYTLLDQHPDLKFSVEGHTDSDGDDAFNQTLSEARAKTVMDKLVSMGISADRLKSKGWGETMPVTSNGTAEEKAENRRVEFIKVDSL